MSTTIVSWETFHLFYLNGLLLHTQILRNTKVEEASLLVPMELGRGGFESLLEHDSKAQPPFVYLLGLPHS
jgi:hypothetical protein